MVIGIYTVTSELHDEASISKDTKAFLGSLQIEYDFKGEDFSDYGTHTLNLIYVRTGGTEGIFVKLLPDLLKKTNQPFYLLTSGRSNSLAASMEILSYLQQQRIDGKILHGSPEYIRKTILLLEKVAECRQKLKNSKLGIIGQPSDWLISSNVDPSIVQQKLGIDLVSLPIAELIQSVKDVESAVPLLKDELDPLKIKIAPICDTDRSGLEASLPGALHIYHALKAMVEKHGLKGFTLRCFDLLSAVRNTGCTALAKLNSEGVVAGCEGDVPAMLSMYIALALTACTGFQANPSSIDPEKGEILFAHCTINLSMVDSFELDTHFESGIGVGIRGFLRPGPITIFKVSHDLTQFFAAEAEIEGCEGKEGVCRTQVRLRLKEKGDAMYFLTRPLGNHHILIPGCHKALLSEFMHSVL